MKKFPFEDRVLWAASRRNEVRLVSEQVDGSPAEGGVES